MIEEGFVEAEDTVQLPGRVDQAQGTASAKTKASLSLNRGRMGSEMGLEVTQPMVQHLAHHGEEKWEPLRSRR